MQQEFAINLTFPVPMIEKMGLARLRHFRNLVRDQLKTDVVLELYPETETKWKQPTDLHYHGTIRLSTEIERNRIAQLWIEANEQDAKSPIRRKFHAMLKPIKQKKGWLDYASKERKDLVVL